MPKIDEVRVVMNSISPDFISITETWLQGHVVSNFVELNGYVSKLGSLWSECVRPVYREVLIQL